MVPRSITPRFEQLPFFKVSSAERIEMNWILVDLRWHPSKSSVCVRWSWHCVSVWKKSSGHGAEKILWRQKRECFEKRIRKNTKQKKTYKLLILFFLLYWFIDWLIDWFVCLFIYSCSYSFIYPFIHLFIIFLFLSNHCGEKTINW
jgi:hypothetical protein